MSESISHDAGGESFVIQKHALVDGRIHYDVRLESDGALVSWSVPDGPSYDPGEQRRAMHAQDRPLEHQRFEGHLPEGMYGGGTVLVWDTGTYRNLSRSDGEPMSIREGVERGEISIWLDGVKLQGGWLLRATEEDRKWWVMTKQSDQHADSSLNIVATAPRSVLSDRDLDDFGLPDS